MSDSWVGALTVLVAVVGLALSGCFSSKTIWDNRRKSDQEALNKASERLASDNPSDRVLGLEVLLDYIPRPAPEKISRSARRLVLAAMQYEDSAFVTYRAAEGLAGGPDAPGVISEALEINRLVWRDTRTIFEEWCMGGQGDACTSRLLTNTSMLRQNRRLLELLIEHARRLDRVDLSETFPARLPRP